MKRLLLFLTMLLTLCLIFISCNNEGDLGVSQGVSTSESTLPVSSEEQSSSVDDSPTPNPPTVEEPSPNGIKLKLLQNDTYAVVGVDTEKDIKQIIIPSSYNNKNVTEIKSMAFCDQAMLESIVIPNTITKIGESAFKGCTSLKSIEIPDSVTEMGYFIFESCSALESVKLSIGCSSIPRCAFYKCTSLNKIVIPEGVTEISYLSFADCDALVNVSIPNSIVSISGYAFDGSNSIEYAKYNNAYYLGNDDNHYLALITATNKEISSCEIIEDARVIAGSAFRECTLLKSITIPEGIVTIGSATFSGCSSLEEIAIPNSVTLLDEVTFSGCTSLKNAIIGDGVPEIGYSAFKACTALESVTIGNGVLQIQQNAFKDCTALKKVNIRDIGAWCSISFYDYHENPLYNAGTLYLNGSLVTNLVIPDTVTEINRYAFFKCSSITSLSISDSVTKIGKFAFSQCDSLKSIDTGDGVSNIGERAFFSCDLLEVVTIGSSVSVIEEDAFYLSNAIKETHIRDLEAWCKISFTYTTSNPLYNKIPLYLNGSPITRLVIPDTITEIKESAFEACTSITEVVFPNGLTKIGNYAFENCSSIKSVSLPDSLIEIGDCAFYACTLLESITFPERVTYIGGSAFAHCGFLTSVRIPNSVETIFASTFTGCTFIEYAEYDNALYLGNENNPYFILIKAKDKSITSCTIHENTKIIAGSAFSYSAIVEIIIPSSVRSIMDHAFMSCEELERVVILEGTTSIGEHAFSDCYSLTGISLPKSISHIERGAFYSSSVKNVFISDLNAWCNITFDYNDSNPLFRGASLYLNAVLVTELIIPDTITEIKNFTFFGCSSITSIKIHDKVSHIGYCAFASMKSIKEIVIPSSVELINGYVFTGSSLLSIYCMAQSEPEAWDEHWTQIDAYWYSEAEPSQEGYYWHYGLDGEFLIWEDWIPEEPPFEDIPFDEYD